MSPLLDSYCIALIVTHLFVFSCISCDFCTSQATFISFIIFQGKSINKTLHMPMAAKGKYFDLVAYFCFPRQHSDLDSVKFEELMAMWLELSCYLGCWAYELWKKLHYCGLFSVKEVLFGEQIGYPDTLDPWPTGPQIQEKYVHSYINAGKQWYKRNDKEYSGW